MDKEKACAILGISLDHKENAKKAYLRLSKEKHPDRGGDPDEFLLIHEAYKTLVEVERPEVFRSEKLEFCVKVSLEEAVFGVAVETHIRPQSISSVSLPSPGRSAAYVDVVTVTERMPPMALLKGPMVVNYSQIKIGAVERDISISYAIREHERYRICEDRSKALLSVDETIPVMVALEGGIIEVDTMFGPRKLNIDSGTNIGDSYTLNNHGPLGNLEVVISGIKMPERQEAPPDGESEKRAKMVEEEDDQLKKNEEDAARMKSQARVSDQS